MTPNEKYQKLLTVLSGCGSLAVACSGGVDSSFLLKAAQTALGGQVLALTVDSAFVPRSEIQAAEEFCLTYGIRQKLVNVDVLSVPGVADNPPHRCYFCKRGLFEHMLRAAGEEGFCLLAEGSNIDDVGDYRPGMRAIAELGVLSPLRDAGLSKADIRMLAREIGLNCWDKPSAACLASRIAYHEPITREKLSAVEQAESLLRSIGIRQCRVRVHDKLARIEVPPEDFPLLTDQREWIVSKLKALGFHYITLDLAGFRSGSMNEILKK